jgi:hypothetical protein
MRIIRAFVAGERDPVANFVQPKQPVQADG